MTTRDYAQTLELLRLHDIPHDVVGPGHGGAGALGKARAMAGAAARAPRLRQGARGSTSRSPTRRTSFHSSRGRSGYRSAYAFDYEFARVQHGLGCRAASRVVVPDAIPQDRLDRLGARAAKVRRYPGLKEEYYLAGFEADPRVLDELGLEPERVLVVVRTPPDVSLYHRHGNPLFGDVLAGSGSTPGVQAVVLPRTTEQRSAIAALGLPSVIEPGAAPSTRRASSRYADLVVSAGGTMNREAVALGVPVYTTFAGRLGAVDEALLRDGRLRASRRRTSSSSRSGRPRPRPWGAIRHCSSTCCSTALES